MLVEAWLALAGVAASGVDLVKAVRDTDLMGLLCLVTCVGLSVASWAVIFFKTWQINSASRQSDAFVERVVNRAASLEEVYKRTPGFPSSPLASILREAYLELEVEDWYQDRAYSGEERLTAARVGVERVIERTISTEIRHLESHLIFLATVTSVAPFIGLFGTVWGVLAAFQALSNAGTAALAALAPGMATALVATIAGLMAAIPASVFYNYLTNRIAVLISRMDSFGLEVANILQKRLIQESAGARM